MLTALSSRTSASNADGIVRYCAVLQDGKGQNSQEGGDHESKMECCTGGLLKHIICVCLLCERQMCLETVCTLHNHWNKHIFQSFNISSFINKQWNGNFALFAMMTALVSHGHELSRVLHLFLFYLNEMVFEPHSMCTPSGCIFFYKETSYPVPYKTYKTYSHQFPRKRVERKRGLWQGYVLLKI